MGARVRITLVLAILSLVAASVSPVAAAESAAPDGVPDLGIDLSALKEGKLDVVLNGIAATGRAPEFLGSARDVTPAPGEPGPQVELTRVSPESVVVDVVAVDNPDLLADQLATLGMTSVSTYGRMVSGSLPIAAVDGLEGLSQVQFARAAGALTNVGLVTSQGDRSMRTDEVREQFDVDGTGTRVGVLSDSFGCLTGPIFPGNPFTSVAEDQANDDLADDIIVLKDFTDEAQCIDEGRAMLQLIHDVAPGADGAFYTAFDGVADFANGIIELALSAGSDVIVDDVIYLAEPMFADGVIAQAANTVRSLGIPYYSSAGNRARQSYEAPYREVEGAHDFDPGPDVDLLQSLSIAPGSFDIFSFQWDEPYASTSLVSPGSASDLDILLFDESFGLIPGCDPDGFGIGFPAAGPGEPCQFPGLFPNMGDDPVELAAIDNPTDEFIEINVLLTRFDGPAPNIVKYVYFGDYLPNEWDTASPTTYGHNNAAGAEAVGAAIFSQTEEFPQPDPLVGSDCIPACVNSFSSAGGVPILFDTDGNRLATPQVRLKPGITGPDGGNTTFFFADSIRDEDAFPNFFGTSASAPHVAALAALVYDYEDAEIAATPARRPRWDVCVAEVNGRNSRLKDRKLRPADARVLIENGLATFRECDAITTDEIIDLFRFTAQDMTLRAFPSTAGGFVVTVDDPVGFDFDTGFGFIDAVAIFDALGNG